MRKLNIGKHIWEYSVGTDYVVILSPARKRFNVKIPDITGEPYDKIERAKWKGYWKGVRPARIKSYIETNLKEQ